jgi:hypothetical protein
MPAAGKLPGRYNIVVADEYDLFDHRVPLNEFEEMLRENEVPDEVCVVGLADAFEADERVDELSRLMDRRANDLESRSPLPTIQFAIDGAFQRRKRDFELQAGGDLHRLSRVFGSQIERQEQGWLLAPF